MDISQLQLGDIVTNSEHVMVYVGDGKIVHSRSTDGLTYQLLTEYSGGYTNVFRLPESLAAQISEADLNCNGEVLNLGSGKANENMSNFYYNGIPDGKYSVTKGALEVLVSALKDLAEFFIGFIPNIIKMSLVGWTAIAESLVTSTIKTVTGGDDIINTPVTSTEIDSGDNITIEKIVFNEISIFDVNFFNFNEEDDEEEPKEEIPE